MLCTVVSYKIMKGKFYIFCILFLTTNIAIADSLLQPVYFPKTFDDVSFSDKYKILSEDYEHFSELTPYEQLEIASNDIAAQDEVVQNQSETTSDDTPIQNFDNDRVEINDDFGGKVGGCSIKNPEIPVGQKIPVGKPTYESDYRVCSKYGWRRMKNEKGEVVSDFHYGFDIGCTLQHKGRPVFTTADGVVQNVIPNHRGSSAGNYIIVNHGNGFTTHYMHLNDMLVKKGQQVYAGCQIATIGHTGGAKVRKKTFENDPHPTMSANISHLHYQIGYSGPQTSVTVGGRTVPIVHKPGHSSVDPAPFMGADPKYYYKP